MTLCESQCNPYLNTEISGDVKGWFNGIDIWADSGSRYHGANPDQPS